jgi:general secretion pathway protein A
MSNDHKKSASYESFFGLRRKPFGLTPDPRFFYYSKKHREALAQLIYGVKERKGFIVLSGKFGTGKTTTIKALLGRLGENFQVSYLLNPKLPITGFLRYVCNDFGLKVDGNSKIDYLMKLHDFLLDSHENDKITTLIVDEAQTLDSSMFEEIRMLTNLETSHQKLLQIILVGKAELDDLLDQGELWQLKQRISTRYHLLPLECQETKEYIQTRISVAGARNLNCFTEGAIQEIYTHSGGIPRLINMVCDKCLFLAYGRKSRFIDQEVVRASVADLKLDRVPERFEQRVKKGGFFFAGRPFSYAPVVLILIFLAIAISGMAYFLRSRLHFPEDRRPSKPLSESKQIEAARMGPDQEVRTTEEGEGAHVSPQSEPGLGMASLVPKEASLRDSAAGEAGGVTELEIPPSSGDSRDLGEDSNRLDEGQVIRLPRDKVAALSTGAQDLREEEEDTSRELQGEGKEKMASVEGARIVEPPSVGIGQAERVEMDSTPSKRFRTEEEILIELGEIKGPEGKVEKDRLSGETSIADLRESQEREAAEILQAEASQQPSETREKPGDEKSVAASSDIGEIPKRVLKGAEESAKVPRTEVEPEKSDEKKKADIESERLTASVDTEAFGQPGDKPMQESEAALQERGQRDAGSRLAATENEVKQFFANYVERYNRKDLDGFLSLFSPRAVQNGTDDVSKIRTTYLDFFRQSREIQYHLDNTRIQIYQNAVEARANYRVDQVPRGGQNRMRTWTGDVHWILVREDGALRIISLDFKHRGSR